MRSDTWQYESMSRLKFYWLFVPCRDKMALPGSLDLLSHSWSASTLFEHGLRCPYLLTRILPPPGKVLLGYSTQVPIFVRETKKKTSRMSCIQSHLWNEYKKAVHYRGAVAQANLSYYISEDTLFHIVAHLFSHETAPLCELICFHHRKHTLK